MTRRLHFALLVGILLTAGLLLTVYQVRWLGLPLFSEESQSLWTVEARLTFDARPGRPILARMLVPRVHGDVVDLGESFVSRGYGVTIESAGPDRRSTWSIRRASGRQTLYYRVILGISSRPPEPANKEPTSVVAPALPPAEALAVQTLLDSIRRQSANIETFATETLRHLREENDQSVRLLVGKEPRRERLVETAVLVLRSANIPARVVHALPLQENPNASLEVLVSAYDGESWLLFDPATGRQVAAHTMLSWWQGEGPMLDVEGGRQPDVRLSVAGREVTALLLAREAGAVEESPWLSFSLLALPLQTQQLWRVLVMIPVGVCMIVFLRSFIGIETFGTFMPALIALSFRETELLNGIALFSVLIAIGMAVRMYLEHLKLLLVPRLAVILTIVVLVMGGITILSHRLGFDRGLSVALFPMVIVAMTIERMTILWEERGAWRALVVGVGSLITAAVVYLVMSAPMLVHLFFTFPGLLLVIMAFMLLAGSYRGYRLLELRRFRVLARE